MMAKMVKTTDVIPLNILKILNGFLPKVLPEWCAEKEYVKLDANLETTSFDPVVIRFKDGDHTLFVGNISKAFKWVLNDNVVVLECTRFDSGPTLIYGFDKDYNCIIMS